MTNSFKILVVGPAWVGDMVMAQSLFMRLKELHPECQIDVLAPSWTQPLLTRMPEVNKAMVMPFKRGELGLHARIQFGKNLRDEQYDQAILLPNTWKSALLPFFANIPLRTGFIGECRWGLLNDARRLVKQQLPMTVQRFVSLAHPKQQLFQDYPIPKLQVTGAHQQTVIEKFAVSQNTPIVALCPGAEYGPAKQWPADYYAEVARQQLERGHQVWLFGSPKDQAIAAQINQMTRNACIDLAGRTSLIEALDLLSLARVVVSNDSGLMHVAAALDKPLIAIYGSSDPRFTPPLHQHAKILDLNLACSPCFKRICPLQHTHCLTELKPVMVLNTLAEWL